MASEASSSSSEDLIVKEFGADYGGRVKGVTFSKAVVIGSVATPFGKKRESDGHTHSWKVYIKPFRNEDYSSFIKKVEFKLHDSYAEQKRIITKPPYTISETGWGEFEIPIKIFFADPTERPVTLHHSLKLFANTDGDEGNALLITTKNKAVTAEAYDEIVFQEPTKYMKSLLENLKPITTDESYGHATDFDTSIKNSAKQISDAHQKVRAEIAELQAKLLLSKNTVDSFTAQLEDKRNELWGPDPDDIKTKKVSKKKPSEPGSQKPSPKKKPSASGAPKPSQNKN